MAPFPRCWCCRESDTDGPRWMRILPTLAGHQYRISSRIVGAVGDGGRHWFCCRCEMMNLAAINRAEEARLERYDEC